MTTSLKFISLSDKPDSLEIYSDENIIIRDVKDLAKKEFYRQLVFKNCANEVESEIKLFTVSENDSKSINYNPVKTSKLIKQKKLKSCFDSNTIISHFVRVAISATHFLDCSNWNDKPLEILIIGGTIGILPYFTKRIFKEFANITVLEENNKLQSIGAEYFGLSNDQYTWSAASAVKFIKSKNDHNLFAANKDKYTNNNLNTISPNVDMKKENRSKNKVFVYDLIVINESNFIQGEKISPNPNLINAESLLNFKVSFKKIFNIN